MDEDLRLPHRLELGAVDKRPVRAPEVLDIEPVVPVEEDGVPPGHHLAVEQEAGRPGPLAADSADLDLPLELLLVADVVLSQVVQEDLHVVGKYIYFLCSLINQVPRL